MKSKIVIGIDYSLTSPAICISKSPEDFQIHFIAKTLKQIGSFADNSLHGDPYPPWKIPMERYVNLANWTIMKIAEANFKDSYFEIFLEGYAMSAKGRIFDIAEGTCILKYLLWQNSFSVNIIEPTVLKKQATGKGNAKKTQMGEVFQKETGLDLGKILSYNGSKSLEVSPQSDIADAFLLAKLGWTK